MTSFISASGERTIYRNDEIECVCVDFDYWGIKKILQVPYAGVRPIFVAEAKSIEDAISIPAINYCNGLSIFPGINRFGDIPQITDHALQGSLALLKNDKTGKENTDALLCIDDPIAIYCRRFRTNMIADTLPMFDLGNLYETAILYIESDNIDRVDPTSEYWRHRCLGIKNYRGRFCMGNSCGQWTSSKHIKNKMIYLNSDGLIKYGNDGDKISVIPTNCVIAKE